MLPLSSNPGEPAVVHDGHTIAEADKLIIIGRIEQDSGALIGEAAHELIQLLFGPNVDAAGGIIEQDDPWRIHQPFCEDHLLLIAARQRIGGSVDVGGLDLQ